MPTLSRSFCIEILGGQIHKVIEQGVEIPTTMINFFSTSEDAQHAIEIHVLRADARLSRAYESLGKYLVRQIPEAPKGVARVGVRFEVDDQENLKLTAFDYLTGKELPIALR